MQVDGHHAATYVAARIAGFTFEEAEKVAYAAQYVDDATNGGAIYFLNSQYLYSRIASAHKMIDYDNFVDVSNHLAWIPFHFLPGNNGQEAGAKVIGGELSKLVCRPDSYVARDMLKYAMKDKSHPRALHRLGIAMHVYADTFSHQGFVGASSIGNQVTDLTSGDRALDQRIKEDTKEELITTARKRIKAAFQVIFKVVMLIFKEHRNPTEFIKAFLQRTPVGHAGADVYPDHPYLKWKYINNEGTLIQRDNHATFMAAIEMMVKAMRAWRANDDSMALEDYEGIDDENRSVIDHLFRTQTSIKGEDRHKGWMQAIESGQFDFGNKIPAYNGKGKGSWKDLALGTEKTIDTGLEQYSYSDQFLDSDWKHFHDALQIHRSDIVHEILPKYGICAA